MPNCLLNEGAITVPGRLYDHEFVAVPCPVEQKSDPMREHSAVNYRFHPFREALMVGITVFAVISIATAFIYSSTLSAMKGEIREGLARTASVVALSIDGELHKSFKSASQEGTPEYAQALWPLVRARQADSTMKYVYTVVLFDGKPHFILDATEQGHKNTNGVEEKSHIMQLCEDASPVMIDALSHHKTLTEEQPYQDAWGSSISGYAPFYDNSGAFVGIVGVDLDARNFQQRIEPIRRATIRAVVTGFFTAFIVGSLVWFMRNFSRIINSSRLRIHAELLKERQS